MIGQIFTWFLVFFIGSLVTAVCVYGFVQFLLKVTE